FYSDSVVNKYLSKADDLVDLGRIDYKASLDDDWLVRTSCTADDEVVMNSIPYCASSVALSSIPSCSNLCISKTVADTNSVSVATFLSAPFLCSYDLISRRHP